MTRKRTARTLCELSRVPALFLRGQTAQARIASGCAVGLLGESYKPEEVVAAIAAVGELLAGRRPVQKPARLELLLIARKAPDGSRGLTLHPAHRTSPASSDPSGWTRTVGRAVARFRPSRTTCAARTGNEARSDSESRCTSPREKCWANSQGHGRVA